MFIGRLGSRELAAISFTFPVVMVVRGLAQGLGAAVTALVARSIGAGHEEAVKRITADGIALALLFVGGFVAAGLLTIDPVFRFLGANDETLGLVR